MQYVPVHCFETCLGVIAADDFPRRDEFENLEEFDFGIQILKYILTKSERIRVTTTQTEYFSADFVLNAVNSYIHDRFLPRVFSPIRGKAPFGHRLDA